MFILREEKSPGMKDIKHLGLLVPAMAASSLVSAQAQHSGAKRPNIIHIMSDDHAYQAISAYGDPLSVNAPTPNIDRLASEGMLFRRAYVENSLSTPARACLMTGLYSHQNGQRTLGKGIDTTKTFVSEVFKENGYQTAVVGKWHMQCEPKGFDYYRIFAGQGEYYNPRIKSPDTDGEYIRQEGYATELVTDMALEFLETRDTTRPFILFVHHKAPHRNWLPALKYLELYEDVTFPMPATIHDDYSGRGDAARDQHMSILRDMTMEYDLKVFDSVDLYAGTRHRNQLMRALDRLTEEEKQLVMDSYNERNAGVDPSGMSDEELLLWKYQRYVKDYLRVIHSVDESVGELLGYLEKEGLLDDTVVTYCSDQGFYMGEHGWFDKRFMYEESFRTPLIIRYPSAIKPGVESQALVQNIDFAPTYLDLAGIKATGQMVGRSMVPVLKKGGRSPLFWRRYLYYHYYDTPSEHSVWRHDGVFDKRFKLIHFYDEKGEKPSYEELYDLRTDPSELHNVIDGKKYRRVVRRLSRALDRFREQQGVDEW